MKIEISSKLWSSRPESFLSHRDFVVLSGQESSSSTQTSSNSDSESSSTSADTNSNNLVKQETFTIVQPQKILSRRVKQKRRRDRFFDKSRNIPNDIYFGDVKVPLHVLHSAWSSDHDSSSDSETVSCTISSIRNSKENLRCALSTERKTHRIAT